MKQRNRAAVTTAIVAALAMPAAQAAFAGNAVGKGAGLGALMGLAFGYDPIEGAVRGAAMGAVGGAIAESAAGSDRSRREEASRRRYEEYRLRQLEREKAERDREEAAQQQAEMEQEAQEAAIRQYVGADNYESYAALRSCQHARAHALALAGATSSVPDQKLISRWLEAVIALDQRDAETAEAIYGQLAEEDPDIDTIQQAGLEADKVLLELRQERQEMGLPRCAN